MAAPVLLQSVPKMRTRYGYSDVAEINDAIQAALETTTEALPALLRSDFKRATVVDIFFVHRSPEFARPTMSWHMADRTVSGLSAGGTAVRNALSLSRFLVDSGQTISVRVASTVAGLSDAAQYIDLVSPTNYTLLDAERGILRVMDYDLTTSYVRVEYTAGLSNDTGTPAMFTNAPAWLVEAGMLHAALDLNMNPVVRQDPLDADAVARLQKGLNAIVIDHAKYGPLTFKPVQSIVTLV